MKGKSSQKKTRAEKFIIQSRVYLMHRKQGMQNNEETMRLFITLFKFS